MRTREPLHSATGKTLLAALTVVAGLIFPGCQDSNARALVVATDLDSAELDQIADDFAAWAERQSGLGAIAPEIRWRRVEPGGGPSWSLPSRRGVEVLLTRSPARGGADLEASGDRSERQGRFPHAEVGLLLNRDLLDARALPLPSGWDALDDPRLAGLIALDDPRRDPVTLALASARLSADGWPEGYAALVRATGRSVAVGRVPGSAAGLVGRGGAAVAPAIVGESPPRTGLSVVPLDVPLPVIVSVAQVAPHHQESAQAFLRFLEESHDLAPEPTLALARSRLLARFLGATLVDAQDELVAAVAAVAALERAHPPASTCSWWKPPRGRRPRCVSWSGTTPRGGWSRRSWSNSPRASTPRRG